MIIRRCCQGSCGPQLPDWLVGVMVALLACVFGWFAVVIVRDLFFSR